MLCVGDRNWDFDIEIEFSRIIRDRAAEALNVMIRVAGEPLQMSAYG